MCEYTINCCNPATQSIDKFTILLDAVIGQVPGLGERG